MRGGMLLAYGVYFGEEREMKKQEKIELIQRGIRDTEICRCYFTYDENYFYYYPNEVNDKFILGQEEDDFLLDGYCIRKMSHLRKVELKDDKCNEINRMIGLTEQVAHPGIDISSWKSIFEWLAKQDTYIEIEDALNDNFAIGVIDKVCGDKLLFRPFGSDGIWDEEGWEIRYSGITSVKWGTRYALRWQEYLEKKAQDE